MRALLASAWAGRQITSNRTEEGSRHITGYPRRWNRFALHERRPTFAIWTRKSTRSYSVSMLSEMLTNGSYLSKRTVGRGSVEHVMRTSSPPPWSQRLLTPSRTSAQAKTARLLPARSWVCESSPPEARKRRCKQVRPLYNLQQTVCNAPARTHRDAALISQCPHDLGEFCGAVRLDMHNRTTPRTVPITRTYHEALGSSF